MSTTICCISRRLLRDEKGIAMTEGVIVIPFFLVIWMGLIFLDHTYNARLEAQVEAHNAAFQGALVGRCGGSKDSENRDESIDEAIERTDH